MDKNEALRIVIETLQIAYSLKEELEAELQDIQNPRISTKESKKKVVKRLRLVNNVIYAGEKAKLSLETEIAKGDNPKMRLKPKNKRVLHDVR